MEEKNSWKDKLRDNVAEQYNHFQSSFEKINKSKKYLNYGFTIPGKKQTYEEKQEQLCREVFRLADIKPNDVIVDVGFGSGEQDFLLEKLYNFKKLFGFNIAKKQVKYANNRALKENLNGKMIFVNSQAENMDTIKDGAVDKILAIECAFYFDRPRFYKEASRRKTELHKVGAISQNRLVWEKYFKTNQLNKINSQVRPGTLATARQCFYAGFLKLNSREIRTFLKMGLTSFLVWIGFLLHLIRYDLIVLERRAQSRTSR
jgi:cyclopropane fatty-acyl-phospholipid synthase-like methyltransferase